jgi:hypothetical protein
MNRKDSQQSELRALVDGEIVRLRAMQYGDLCGYRGGHHFRAAGPSGAEYDLEVQAVWDDPRAPDANLRVMVSGWRAGASGSGVSEDFILAPNGSFVGE